MKKKADCKSKPMMKKPIAKKGKKQITTATVDIANLEDQSNLSLLFYTQKASARKDNT